MENKKLGILFIVLSLVFLMFLFYFNDLLYQSSGEKGCIVDSQECILVEKNISITHIAFGFFGFMFSLGFYILFFNKSEERILKRLEDEKNQKINGSKISTKK